MSRRSTASSSPDRIAVVTARRSLLAISLIAALHGVFFIRYQQPDWSTQWTDQEGYRRLGEVLAATGKFTRFPDASPFVPEVIRTPAYPAVVALVYSAFGVRQLPVALFQTGLFVLICLSVYGTARLVVSERVAIAASAAVALFPPIPYFGALVMTEVWTTTLFTLAMWTAVRATREPSSRLQAALGFLIAAATLSRPVFVLFPVALAAVWLVLFPLFRVRPRPSAAHAALMLAVFGLTMLPWFAYNYTTLGRFTLSPAGGIGRGLWEGSWQAVWSGRLQNELTHLADETDDRAELDRRVRAIAARERLPEGEMLDYVHQWQDIRRIWTVPVDPYERAVARVKADEAYERVGLSNIRRDRPAHLARRLARGLFILWSGEIPFRYSEINALPPVVVRVCWAVQALVFLMALVGAYALFRNQHAAEALILLAPILYISAVHFPLFTEARQSLPAQPILLLLAAIGASDLAGRSLAFEPQVHERQHL
jgi:4-amino-4-deoxy-L-arabinose transferase-like glycosyltransferase